MKAVLDMFVFQSSVEVRDMTEHWFKDYNEERLYESTASASGDCRPIQDYQTQAILFS